MDSGPVLAWHATDGLGLSWHSTSAAATAPFSAQTSGYLHTVSPVSPWHERCETHAAWTRDGVIGSNDCERLKTVNHWTSKNVSPWEWEWVLPVLTGWEDMVSVVSALLLLTRPGQTVQTRCTEARSSDGSLRWVLRTGWLALNNAGGRCVNMCIGYWRRCHVS